MKRILTAFVIVSAILLSLFLYQIYKPENPLTTDLASPSQETRDATAKILRDKAKPSSKLKWLFFTWHIKKGESEKNILALLRSYNLSTNIEGGLGGIGQYDEYRLDNYWLLGCEFNNNDYKNLILEKWKLVPRWRDFYVRPATNFSGVWITYYANGQNLQKWIIQMGFVPVNLLVFIQMVQRVPFGITKMANEMACGHKIFPPASFKFNVFTAII